MQKGRSDAEIRDLEAEFRSAWSPDAPSELRELLEELLFPELARRKAEAPLSRL